MKCRRFIQDASARINVRLQPSQQRIAQLPNLSWKAEAMNVPPMSFFLPSSREGLLTAGRHSGMVRPTNGAECEQQKAEVFRTSVIRGLEKRIGRIVEFAKFAVKSARRAR